MAMAGSDLPQAAMAKLTDPDRVIELLDRAADGKVRVIVEFAAPSIPNATNSGDPVAADQARTGAMHRAQDQILGRAFALRGGLAAATSSQELDLKRMDFSPMFALVADRELLGRLANDPAVVRIHEDRFVPPLLNVPAPQTSLQRIQMPEAYAAGATGAGRHVAILDTGGRRSHKFLNSRIVAAACFGTNDAQHGATSYCPDGATSSTHIDSANDCHPGLIEGCGHGTHVAGTAAGFNPSPLTGEPLNGVARDARIISINVFTQVTPAKCVEFGGSALAEGCVLSVTSDQIRGLEHVYSLRNTYAIDAVNMSLGGGQYFSACDDEPQKPIIDQLRAAGIATVIAAGNEYFNNSVGSPGCISSAVTVASSTKADVRSDFSNWGSLIDVVAPGSDINASYISNANQSVFAQISGTSMASPHVAGVFAAIRSARPNATVDQIEAALKSTGTAITAVGTTKPRINVATALNALPGGGVKSVMTQPVPGATIAATSATFTWTAGSGVSSYWLMVGTNGTGSANIFSGGGAQTSRTVSGLPASGTLNVRLMSYIGSSWQFNDYTYTMNSATKAVMTSPTPGSTITNTSATFNWTAGSGATGYWLYVGTNGAGSSNILSQGGPQTSRTVTGLPASGTLNVRLMSYISGGWQFNDYTYTMNAAVKAVMTVPAPGSILENSTTMFQWTASQGSPGYWLMVGTNGPGSANIFNSGVTNTWRAVAGLPRVGTVNVRLMTYIAGGWQSNDYTYTMAIPAVMTTPVPGSFLPGSGVMFQWTSHPSITNYWLYVGNNGAGSSNIFNSGVTNSWRWVGDLPVGGTVNVRLMTWVGGAWRFRDFTYAASTTLGALGAEEFSSLLQPVSLE